MHFAARQEQGQGSGKPETYHNIGLQPLQSAAADGGNNGWGEREADGRSIHTQTLYSASALSPRQELEEARARWELSAHGSRSAKVSGEHSVSSDKRGGRHISGVSGVSGEPVTRGQSYHGGSGAEST